MKRFIPLIYILLSGAILNAQIPGHLDLSFGNNGKVMYDIGNLSNSISAMKFTTGGIVSAGTSSEWEGSTGFLLKTDFEGLIDNTFGTSGRVEFEFGGDNSYINDMVILSDGRILVCGISEEVGNYSIGLAKFTPSGQPDPLFGYSGTLIVDLGAYETANSVILSNNKFLITGTYDNGEDTDVLVMRFLANGSIDNSFGTNGKVIIDLNNNSEDAPRGMFFSNNKYIIASYALHNDYDAIALLRLDTDGNLDSGFGIGGISLYDGMQIMSGIIYAETSLAIDMQGRYYVSGRFEGIEGTDPAIIRFQANGAPDNSYGEYGMALFNIPGNNFFRCLNIQLDGKILAAGSSSVSNNTSTIIHRSDVNGQPDPTFGFDNGYAIHELGEGTYSTDAANCILFQYSNTRILLGGDANSSSDDSDATISRYYTDLSINTNFAEIKHQIRAIVNPLNNAVIELKGINNPGLNSARICSIDGKILYKGEADVISGETKIRLNHALSPGLYLIQLRDTDYSDSGKLFVTH